MCSLKEKTHLLQGLCAQEGLQLLLTFKGAKKKYGGMTLEDYQNVTEKLTSIYT